MTADLQSFFPPYHSPHPPCCVIIMTYVFLFLGRPWPKRREGTVRYPQNIYFSKIQFCALIFSSDWLCVCVFSAGWQRTQRLQGELILTSCLQRERPLYRRLPWNLMVSCRFNSFYSFHLFHLLRETKVKGERMESTDARWVKSGHLMRPSFSSQMYLFFRCFCVFSPLGWTWFPWTCWL